MIPAQDVSNRLRRGIMRKVLTVIVVLAGLMLMASACYPPAGLPTGASASPAAAQPAAATATYTDPVAYCAAVGTIDQPDAAYTGEKTPDAIVQGFIKAAGLTGTTEPSDVFRQATIWRCMGGKVYACNFGANLPCDSKADTNKTPTPEMADFCKANPGADFIPMAVTGHATIYAWKCVKDVPEAGEQIDQADAAGYLARIWYPVEAK
jgi:hypothetical protein